MGLVRFIDRHFIDTQFIDRPFYRQPVYRHDRFIGTTFDQQVHFIDIAVLSKLLFLSLFTYRNTYPVDAIQT